MIAPITVIPPITGVRLRLKTPPFVIRAFNTGLGRDHYDKTFTSLFAGGGIKGQQVRGRTNDDCSACIENGWDHRPQPQIDNLVATIYSALGIDWRKKIENTPSGREYHYVQTAPIGSNTLVAQDHIDLFS